MIARTVKHPVYQSWKQGSVGWWPQGIDPRGGPGQNFTLYWFLGIQLLMRWHLTLLVYGNFPYFHLFISIRLSHGKDDIWWHSFVLCEPFSLRHHVLYVMFSCFVCSWPISRVSNLCTAALGIWSWKSWEINFLFLTQIQYSIWV